jgi:hypothetical protein
MGYLGLITNCAVILSFCLTLGAAPQRADAGVCRQISGVPRTECINRGDIKKDAVNSSRVKNGSLTGADIRNGTIRFADLAPDAVFMRTIVVSPVGPSASDNCDELQAALASLTDNSASRPYVVQLEPGVYDCGTSPVVMKPFVDVEGSGRGVTLITGRHSAGEGVVQMGDNTELRSISITNLGGEGTVVFAVVANGVAAARATDVSATAMNANGTGVAAGFEVVGPGDVTLTNVNALADSAGGQSCGIESAGVPSGATLIVDSAVAEGRNAQFTNAGYCDRTPSMQTIDVSVRNSILIGSDASVLDPGGHVNIANSELAGGPVSGTTGPKCANAYDENFDPLDADCL